MKKPTIVHCLRLDDWGGTETILRNYISVTKGQINHIIISTSAIGEIAREKFSDIKLYELNNKYPEAPIPLLTEEVEQKIAELHPSLVVSWMRHCHSICGDKISNISPVVWTEHDPAIREEMSKRSQDLFDMNATLSHRVPESIIFDSEPIRKNHAEGGYRGDILNVINPGIDTSKFKPDAKIRKSIRALWSEKYNIGEHNCVIGFVGRNSPEKDPTYFLKIAAQLHQKEVGNTHMTHFVMCGNGTNEENAELAQAIEKFGCSDYVHLLGPQDDMPAFYNGIDIYTSTAKREGLSLAAIEAAACGKPFVGTETGDVRKLIKNDGKIISIRPDGADIEQFDVTTAVEALLETKKQISTEEGLRDISKRMRGQATHFSTKKMAAAYSSLFENAMAKAQQEPFSILSLQTAGLTP